MAVSVRSYSTSFPRDEDPISEGGAWLNGRTDGIDWIDCITKDGVCFGAVSRMGVPERRAEQGNLEDADAPEGDYDDPTSVLAGEWGPDQHGTATVFSRNPTDAYFQEVQIRLRHTMRPSFCSGYEVFFRCLKTDEAYAEIVRWNGKIGDWTSLKRLVGPEYGVQNGDVIEATVFGNVLTGSINGVEVISVVDDVIGSGAPGVGFNFGVGDTNVDHGLSSFAVETFESGS
ncbi:MAG: hypothetical protein QOH15_273 [Gaiellales bacterium]|nr:hypothetical protein [Gaiellales bacterium]